MLQTVLGVDADAIAEAFTVPAATMAQRLVRAKRRIRAAGIPFVIGGRVEFADRLPAVLSAVYGAYAIDWQTSDARIESLSAEAPHLALVLAELLPEEPEVLGLAALVCLSGSRRGARRTAGGQFVPLDEQDPRAWHRGRISRGEGLLRRAHGFGRPGRYQPEAAIQSAYCARAETGRIDWPALRKAAPGAAAAGALPGRGGGAGRRRGPDRGSGGRSGGAGRDRRPSRAAVPAGMSDAGASAGDARSGRRSGRRLSPRDRADERRRRHGLPEAATGNPGGEDTNADTPRSVGGPP
jgi:hypothetical protein